MKHIIVLLLSILPFASFGQARLDARLRALEHRPAQTARRAQKSIYDANNTLSVIIETENSSKVVESIKADGFASFKIDTRTATAHIPASYLKTLKNVDGVRFIHSSRKNRLLTNNVRNATNVNLLHNGTYLETPFTGKGVIVGIIDEGFEYRHISFLDAEGNSRVRALWYRHGPDSIPTTEIPTGGDDYDAGSHGTHVAGIAAGSKVGALPYYGMAPESEIIMLPSDLENADLLEEISYVKQFAETEGKPWVVNMSFGTLIGPHDGKDVFSQTVDRMMGEGGLIVAAAGNENKEMLHASHTFTSPNDTVNLLVRKNYDEIYLDIWGQDADSCRHLSLRPYFYSGSTKTYLTETQTQEVLFEDIEPGNKKENYYFHLDKDFLVSNRYFGVEICGDAGTTFHAWTDTDCGIFHSPDASFLSGDDNYLTCDGGANIPRVIAVGSYNTKNSLTNINGNTLSYGSNYPMGAMSSFSSKGPYLGDGLKPTVAAPGALVVSAYSKYTPGFSKTGSSIVTSFTRNNETYYFGFKGGTSMACPVVTGIMALWLQAFPQMTPEQAIEIIEATSTKDAYTTTEQSGYGKIDAYEGLKMALQMAETSGVSSLESETSPVTLLKRDEEWKILFNTSLASAEIMVCDPCGRIIKRHVVSNPSRGEETLINLSDIQAGTYIIGIMTPDRIISRKFIKK